MAQAESGALALSDLQNTKAAEIVRALLQRRTRPSTQNGGVLYHEEARAMIQQTADTDVQKAQRTIDNARAAADNKVKKQWKDICKDMRKPFRARKKRLRLEALRG